MPKRTARADLGRLVIERNDTTSIEWESEHDATFLDRRTAAALAAAEALLALQKYSLAYPGGNPTPELAAEEARLEKSLDETIEAFALADVEQRIPKSDRRK